jgi:cutinase-like protein
VRLTPLRLAAVILMAVVAFLVAPQLLPRAFASCPGVDVVFARGTDEPPGVGVVGGAFVNSLRQQTRKSVEAYGVRYPASKDFLAATDGANDASNHIQQMAGNCPGTKVVLGGYSQGAAVVDIVTAAPLPGLGFRQPLPAGAADHVAAVALFGEPTSQFSSMLWGGQPLPSISPLYAPKTISLCAPDDPICSPGGNIMAHVSYIESGMTNQAATFAVNRLH